MRLECRAVFQEGRPLPVVGKRRNSYRLAKVEAGQRHINHLPDFHDHVLRQRSEIVTSLCLNPRSGHARQDRLDTDAMRFELGRQGLAESQHVGLRRQISGFEGGRSERGERGQVDDHPMLVQPIAGLRPPTGG